MTGEQFLIFILPIILLVGAATVGTAFAFPAAAALPPNTTDWDFGLEYCDCELTDDNLEEDEEKEDEKLHEGWANK